MHVAQVLSGGANLLLDSVICGQRAPAAQLLDVVDGQRGHINSSSANRRETKAVELQVDTALPSTELQIKHVDLTMHMYSSAHVLVYCMGILVLYRRLMWYALRSNLLSVCAMNSR